MSLKIIRRGLFSTLQERSRYEFGQEGLAVGGAIDSFALLAANLLVGNEEGEPALEITLLGPEILFEREALIAVCGGDLEPTVDGQAIPNWRPVYVHAGSVLRFGDAKSGFRAYLAVSGGFEVPTAQNYRFSSPRPGASLHQGHALREGDTLQFGLPSETGERRMITLREKAKHRAFATTPWFVSHEIMPSYNAKRRIRVLRSGEFAEFSSGSRERIFTSPFQLKPETDRLHYRLDGVSLRLEQSSSATTSASSELIGAIGLPDGDEPVIQMSTGVLTTAHIANVIPVDFPVLSQVRPGERIKFHEISIQEAQELAYLREMGLHILKNTILAQNR
ncbi:biotin-dependent carboxyltransferase family protein [Tumebacillus permanentifrigoris]|uniref:Antagonist of KipI n=1 Tax=Tumebacillus permanentifrigoris TaxID=378543 RepID=A0A316DFL9_9BACL|nr:biotin-dependent carboxyltransferase family protein [Tumebacillus permanentifrigoris]PWK16398.1 antagonist of KipI [Tumebacillus permanentifrigoris]